ncbi:MAG: substrate-binding domain-containing protein [Actinobacteria bacterium]|nr:substrate-binding domain-containing protein [Actinomycetota bacterium]
MHGSLTMGRHGRHGRQLRRKIAVAALALGMAALTACGSSAVTGGNNAKNGTGNAPNPTATVGLSAVPQGAKGNYSNYNLYAKLYPNAYANYKPPSGKAKFCFSTFFLANTFQQGIVTAFKQMVTQLASQGKAQSGLTVESSNNNTATQVSQLQSEVNSGCNVIFLANSSTTAFCSTFNNAIKQNVLIISLDPEYCNNTITVSFDVYQNSFNLAAALYKAMNYQGNLLEITGVPGVADAATATAAAAAARQGHPGLKVVGNYTGQWTASVAQTATSQWIATHPGVKVDGIIDEGAMGVAAETALQQAGRPLAKVSLQEGDCQELAFEKLHPDLVPFMTDQAPAPGAYAAMNVALRMLAGQQPALDTILYPIPGPTAATFNQWYTPNMTVSSACFASPKPAIPAMASYLGQFFTGGSTVGSFPTPS